MDLRTSRLELLPLDPDEHAEALHAVYGDPAVMRWWTCPERASVERTRQLLTEELAGPGALLWAVRRAEDGAVIGVTGLLGGVALPGLTWILARRAWGRGFAAEAAAAVVDHAFRHVGHDRVEAWVESTNTRSIAVCRKVGLTERGRFVQRYGHRDRPHEMIVLGRAGTPDPVSVVHLQPVVQVVDVAATAALLVAVLGARVSFIAGEPAHVAGIVLGPWSTGPGLRLVRPPRGECAPVELVLDVGPGFVGLRESALASGVAGVEPIVDQPWGRREFALRLPEGHRVVLSTPS
ncbi:GNAT family N-acetyltransferase [Actinosynnema mirum]|uniref:GCN5-related N-acetyltransferase n=1 Tax=Actinosynnema mirum (strain ATCC 29888 / DSM 43827 / JCM 3225 / NBRC 14064 / NCIMB 13271 / NRRL B-12336 / IMRU 3971 / 101) TaxID=446462 RepID=C6WBY0_ACTMD|nr:GNAT family N-acetyltransferase [Actinosynnema mirum]ACU37547.1 GCN5-related N-acetyltransferase [Actinosynnema mirum DSM 43827]